MMIKNNTRAVTYLWLPFFHTDRTYSKLFTDTT